MLIFSVWNLLGNCQTQRQCPILAVCTSTSKLIHGRHGKFDEANHRIFQLHENISAYLITSTQETHACLPGGPAMLKFDSFLFFNTSRIAEYEPADG